MQFLLDEKRVTKAAYLLTIISSVMVILSIKFYFNLNNALCVASISSAILISISCTVIASKHAIATNDDDCLLSSLRSGFGVITTALYLIFTVFSLLTNLSDTIFQTINIILLLLLADLLVLEIDLIKKPLFIALSLVITIIAAASYYMHFNLAYQIIYAAISIVLIILSVKNIANKKYTYFSVTVLIFQSILLLSALFTNADFAGYICNGIEFIGFNIMLIGAIKFTDGIKAR